MDQGCLAGAGEAGDEHVSVLRHLIEHLATFHKVVEIDLFRVKVQRAGKAMGRGGPVKITNHGETRWDEAGSDRLESLQLLLILRKERLQRVDDLVHAIGQ